MPALTLKLNPETLGQSNLATNNNIWPLPRKGFVHTLGVRSESVKIFVLDLVATCTPIPLALGSLRVSVRKHASLSLYA